MDSPARKGLRDHSQSSNGHGQTLSVSSSTAGTATDTCNNNTTTTGILPDLALFSPSDPNLQPYSTNSAAIFHDAIAARMARIKRSFLPSTSSSAFSHSSTNSSSFPLSSSSSHELHSPPGCVLPVQIDIYSLGVMFYYTWASYSTFLREDLTPGTIAEGLNSFASGHGLTVAGSGACLPSTPIRLANVIHKMVAKSSRDRFLSMIQVRKELTAIRDQEQEAQKKEAELKV
ncbi:hypothetical protein BGZ80_011314 [Entomortierella chlamydospora]|uniref:Protein kinase domain-containing protein n=1 Tax=Entomortierella chlamydospora TaxID=101097 RepID=A0A9P6MU18_9FUNG|nr:hypothetical protein BGZ80_011314 [Entomortierella chlamydospora]